MRVLVTGHKGYIGPHLIELLKAERLECVGVDLGLFSGCEWGPMPEADVEVTKDFRHLTLEELRGVDCVIHLAALSNDPMGAIDEKLTYAVNREGTIELAQKAKRAGVSRFLFSSSCSIYGKGVNSSLSETDLTNPVSAYAISKIDAEREILRLADENFSPSFLRNATAYGHSPMLRIDLVVNNLLASALSFGQIQVKSDGSPWRPLIHCRDIARAFVAFTTAPRETIHSQVVNVGANRENYQVKDIASLVQELIPTSNIVFTGEVGEDPRNYRVNFDKLIGLIPGFHLNYSLEKGMHELLQRMLEAKFSSEDFNGPKFVRLRTLKDRLRML
jgi:nucleoside-diphosphate-sugar epimerase